MTHANENGATAAAAAAAADGDVRPDDHVQVYLQIGRQPLHLQGGEGVVGETAAKPRVLKAINETTLCIQDETVTNTAAQEDNDEDENDNDNSEGEDNTSSASNNEDCDNDDDDQPQIIKGETMSFDRVFHASSTTEESDAGGANNNDTSCIDSICAGLPEQLLQGYNCTVLAYGARGTGKTRSVLGKSRRKKRHLRALQQLKQQQQQQATKTATTNTATSASTATTSTSEIATMTDDDFPRNDQQGSTTSLQLGALGLKNDHLEGGSDNNSSKDENDGTDDDDDDDDDEYDKPMDSDSQNNPEDLSLDKSLNNSHISHDDSRVGDTSVQQEAREDDDHDNLLEDEHVDDDDDDELDDEPGMVVRLAREVFAQLQGLQDENEDDDDEDEPIVQEKKPSPREMFARLERNAGSKSDFDFDTKDEQEKKVKKPIAPSIVKVSLSVVEIYLERMIDLLYPASTAVLAPVHVLPNGSLAGTTSLSCVTSEDVEDCLRMAVARRTGSSMAGEQDDHSHRSSLLVQMTVEQTTPIPNLDNEEEEIHTKLQVRRSVLQVYDLCDSDLAIASVNGTGEETVSGQITRNLVSLQQQVQKCLPSRDMPILCRLLEPTWDGHASARVLVSVSPQDTAATRNSLKFAADCRKLALSPIRHVSTYYREQDRDVNDNSIDQENVNPKEEEWLKRQERLTTLVHALAGECQRLQKAKGGGGGGLSRNRQVWQAIHEIEKVKAQKRTLDFSVGTKKEHEIRAETFHLKTEKRQAEQERDAALATVAQVRSDLLVLKEEHQSLQKRQKQMEEELEAAKSEVPLLQQRKQEVEHTLRTSQFRECEAVVFLRQFRRFYMRLLKTNLMEGSAKDSTEAESKGDMLLDVLRNVPGAPDLNELIDMDRLMVESGLLEDDEVGQDGPNQSYQPSRDALLRSTKGADNAIEAATKDESENDDEGVTSTCDKDVVDLAHNPDGNSVVQRPVSCETTEARQHLYKTPAGRFIEMREKAMEQELLRLTDNYVKVQSQLEEEKANVEILTDMIGADDAKEKLTAAKEIKKLKDRIERKGNDLKAVIWKLNEMHIVGKSFQQKCVDREQHVAHLEEKLLTIQKQNGSMLREKVESEQNLRTELRSLRQNVYDLSIPIWQLSRSRPRQPPLQSRLVVPFASNAAPLGNKKPIRRRLSLGESEEWMDMKFDFRPVGVQVVEAEVQTDLGGKEMDVQTEEIATLTTTLDCSRDDLALSTEQVKTLETEQSMVLLELEETKTEQTRASSALDDLRSELQRAKAENTRLHAELEQAQTAAPGQFVHVASGPSHISTPIMPAAHQQTELEFSQSLQSSQSLSVSLNSIDESDNGEDDEDDVDDDVTPPQKEMAMSDLLFMDDTVRPTTGLRASIYNGLVDAYNNVSIQTDKDDNAKPSSPDTSKQLQSVSAPQAASPKQEPRWKAALSHGQSPSWKRPKATYTAPTTGHTTHLASSFAPHIIKSPVKPKISAPHAFTSPVKPKPKTPEPQKVPQVITSPIKPKTPEPPKKSAWSMRRMSMPFLQSHNVVSPVKSADGGDEIGASKEPEWLKKFRSIGSRNHGEAVIETSGGSEAKEATRTSFGETLKRNNSADGTANASFASLPPKTWSPRKKKEDDDESVDSFTKGFLSGASAQVNVAPAYGHNESSSSEGGEDDSESEKEKEDETPKVTQEVDKVEEESVAESQVAIEEESFDRKKLNSMFQAKAAAAKPLVPTTSYAPSYTSSAKKWTPKPKKTDDDSDDDSFARSFMKGCQSTPAPKPLYASSDDEDSSDDESEHGDGKDENDKTKPHDSDSDDSSDEESTAAPTKPSSTPAKKKSFLDDSSDEETTASETKPTLAKQAAHPVPKKKSFLDDSSEDEDEESTAASTTKPLSKPVKKKSFLDDSDSDSDDSSVMPPRKTASLAKPTPPPPVLNKPNQGSDDDSSEEEAELLPPKSSATAAPPSNSKDDDSNSDSEASSVEEEEEKPSTKPVSSDDDEDSDASSVKETPAPAPAPALNSRANPSSEDESSDEESEEEEPVPTKKSPLPPKKDDDSESDSDSESESDDERSTVKAAKAKEAAASFNAFCGKPDQKPSAPAPTHSQSSTSFFDDSGDKPAADLHASGRSFADFGGSNATTPAPAPAPTTTRKNEKAKHEKERKSKFIIKGGKLVKEKSTRSVDSLAKSKSAHSVDSSDDGPTKGPPSKQLSKMFAMNGDKVKSGAGSSRASGKHGGKKKTKFVIKGGKLIKDDSSIGVTSIASLMTQKTGQNKVRRNSFDSKTDAFDTERRAKELTERQNRTSVTTSMMPAPRAIKVKPSSQPSFKILNGKIVKSEEPAAPALPAFSIVNGKLVKSDSTKKLKSSKKKKGEKSKGGKERKRSSASRKG